MLTKTTFIATIITLCALCAAAQDDGEQRLKKALEGRQVRGGRDTALLLGEASGVRGVAAVRQDGRGRRDAALSLGETRARCAAVREAAGGRDAARREGRGVRRVAVRRNADHGVAGLRHTMDGPQRLFAGGRRPHRDRRQRHQEVQREERRSDHEGYTAGYFLESAIVHYMMTDKKDARLYDAAKKLVDCWDANLGPAPKKG